MGWISNSGVVLARALLLLAQGFVGLPETVHFRAMGVAVADAVTTIADSIDGGSTGGGADAADKRHGLDANGTGLRVGLILSPRKFHFDITSGNEKSPGWA